MATYTEPQRSCAVMSTSVGKEGKKRRRTLVLGPSSRTGNASVSGLHGVPTNSLKSFSLGAGSKVLDKSSVHTPRHTVRVFDEEGSDVTPQPLYQADPGAAQTKASRFLVDELLVGSASDHTTATGSFTMPFSRSVLGSSRISSQSTIESVNEEIKDTFSKRDLPMTFPDVKVRKDPVKEQVAEDMLTEVIDVVLTETDTISLLDIPSTLVSVDADDAEAVIERNRRYSEVCRNRAGNDRYVERSTQTEDGAAKNKQVQADGVGVADAATTVTCWDMYDALIGPEQGDMVGQSEPERAEYPEAVVDSSRGAERSVSVGSTTSTTASVSSSLRDVEALGTSLTAESELQLIMMSEKFQQCLMVMERSILLNIFQPQLAAYRQLPLLEDPDCPVRPETAEQREADPHSCGSPRMDCLWVYSCELSRGRNVTSLAWNKKNPDILAVGYGDFDSRNQSPGLVCCWSLKNIKWPERVIHCDSTVTSLDFSANSPTQLAVGMLDGSIAIYSIQSQDNKSPVISSRDCPHRHLGPVWQLRWIQQGLSVTAEKVEALFSVGADGRVSRWFVFNNGLDCADLMKIKRTRNTKKKHGGMKTQTADSILTALAPGLCFDFHPTDASIYLTGTSEGLIHRCSSSNSQQFLHTYSKHVGPVNCISWCPLSPDVFLSCSSDWTIQLWKQDHLTPVFSFTSSHRAVHDVKWSPKHATVFGAVSEGQLDIWDLKSSTMDPVIVQTAAPGLRLTSLLFALQTDCVVVGDSGGQVSVYMLKNLSVGEDSQVEVLEDLIHSAACR